MVLSDDGSDLLTFRNDGETEKKAGVQNPWKLLLVDDDPEVHTVTKLVLRNFEFEGRPLEFFHAYSSHEARDFLNSVKGIAAVLLDVVMEQDDAGLKLVKWIREREQNKFIRIILRTGQPGAAPERQVISQYDINDYKEKTELSDTKLWTSLIVAFRGYRDLVALNRGKRGLEKIVNSSDVLFERRSFLTFIGGVLNQLTSLLDLDEDSMIIQADAMALQEEKNIYRIISATGAFRELNGKTVNEIEESDLKLQILACITKKRSFFDSSHYFNYLGLQDDRENLLVLRSSQPLSEENKKTIELFAQKTVLAFKNLGTTYRLEETQYKIILFLSSLFETGKAEGAKHPERVSRIAFWLADKLGLPEEEKLTIKLAAPLHDLGNNLVRPGLLGKKGSLDPAEFAEVRQHTLFGEAMFSKTNNPVLRAAARIALNHHERWDGKGYPQELAGEDIPLEARIVGLADVFDVLTHARPYSEAWTFEQALHHLAEEAGKQFDPGLVSLVLNNREEFFARFSQLRAEG